MRSILGFAMASSLFLSALPAQAAAGLDPVWTAGYDNGGIEFASAIAVDASHNVYVTGRSESSSASDYLTIKYSPSGKQLWTARYDGEGDPTNPPRSPSTPSTTSMSPVPARTQPASTTTRR